MTQQARAALERISQPDVLVDEPTPKEKLAGKETFVTLCLDLLEKHFMSPLVIAKTFPRDTMDPTTHTTVYNFGLEVKEEDGSKLIAGVSLDTSEDGGTFGRMMLTTWLTEETYIRYEYEIDGPQTSVVCIETHGDKKSDADFDTQLKEHLLRLFRDDPSEDLSASQDFAAIAGEIQPRPVGRAEVERMRELLFDAPIVECPPEINFSS